MSPLDALAKSDRKAFRSVAAALHLGEEQAEGGVLSDAMFDLNHVAVRSRGK